MIKKIFLFAATLIGIGMIGGLGAGIVMIYQGSNEGASVDLTIPSGMTLHQVSQMLYEEGIVAYPRLTKVVLRVSQGEKRVRTGEFRFQRGMRVADAVKVLYYSTPITYSLTVPEGWNIRQIATGLADLKLVSREKFLQIALSKKAAEKYQIQAPHLEGFLYPDTYAFSKLDGEERIVDTMVKRFFEVWNRDVKAVASTQKLKMEELVTLASVIEKETGIEGERPLISSVFHNRLKKKMRLESDPTTIYGIDNFDGNLRKADLKRHSPYNTYVIKGLPPGPIASTGKASMLAAAQPAQTEFLFFVSNNQGGHIFSRTYKEHARYVNSTQIQPLRKRKN